MKFKTKIISIGSAITVAVGMTFFFQNCAKSKFNDPDPVHTLIVQGLCQECDDDSGTGLSCRTNQLSAFASCNYESCRPGFMPTASRSCAPVICEAGAIANCTVAHGEGRKICNNDRAGYGACNPISCETGFELSSGACIPIPAVCAADSHRDCSTATTEGNETCKSDGTGYDACVLGNCKAGFYKNDSNVCVANTCEPTNITSCTVGAGSGFKTCNSQGSAWGACQINSCESGYTLVDGVCVVQICTPDSKAVCAFDDGTGEKTCSTNGLNYGACNLTDCNPGKFLENGQCVQQKCVPSSQDTCTGESGTGVKFCYENGRGHGPCQLTTCSPGFKLENGLCVRGNECNPGDKFACTVSNGTGERTCTTDGKMTGPCVAKTCNTGYSMDNQTGTPSCKKDKK